MKRIYFSLMTIAVLLFTACNNDVTDNGEVKTGAIQTTFTFEGAPRAAGSFAIPITTWNNVKQVQLFLYDATTGRVAYSRIVSPSASLNTYTWNNVPAGTYRLALLANVKSDTDNIATSVDGGSTWNTFTEGNVIGRQLNNTLKIDLKTATLPGGTTAWGATRKGFSAPSEIFTAYSTTNVVISAGGETVVSDLVLKREVAMMRTRVDHSNLAQPALVSFNNAANFIAIQRIPVGFGLKVGNFDGGILDAVSDVDRVMIGASGTGTYNTINPIAGYNPLQILSDNFTLWNDVHVLPNASEAERTAGNIQNSSAAPSGRKYFIMISAWVQAGYKFTNDPVSGLERIASQPQSVYWYGTIDGVFSKNVIREVNMTLVTAGDPIIPVEPTEEGTLKITVGTPEDWYTTIEETPIES